MSVVRLPPAFSVVRTKTEEGALGQVAEHAQTAHGLEEMPEEVLWKIHAVMRDEQRQMLRVASGAQGERSTFADEFFRSIQ